MITEETKKYFDIERKKHFDFFLLFYKNKNWIVAEDNINANRKMDWDVRLEVFAGDYKKVDEKAIIGDWDNCLIEIIQDIKTLNKGWFFGDKDWTLYGNWKTIEDNNPFNLHLIKMKELKEYVFSLDGIIKTAISHKGWGITWNIALEWDDLIYLKIAQKIL